MDPTWWKYLPWVKTQRRFDTDYYFFEEPLGAFESVLHDISHGVVLGWSPFYMSTGRIAHALADKEDKYSPMLPSCRPILGETWRDWQEVLAIAAEVAALQLLGIKGGRRRKNTLEDGFADLDRLTHEVNVVMDRGRAINLVHRALTHPTTHARGQRVVEVLEELSS